MRESKYMIRIQKKDYSHRPTFDCMDYALSFYFCNFSEKKAIYNVLKDAWKWAFPPVKDDEDKEKE